MLHSDNEEELEKSDSEEEFEEIVEKRSPQKSFQKISEKKLLDSIKEDDPYKEYKILEIKRWSQSYRYILDRYGIGTTLPFFMTIMSDKECWNEGKLDRKEVGSKLLEPTAKDTSGNEVSNYMDDFSRYQIACWCCFEEKAKKLFNKFKDERERLNKKPIQMDEFVKSFSSGKGALTIFWSHHFGEVDVRTTEETKNMDINEYGLECAMAEQFIEAISFFWNKLPEEKKNFDTLMKIAFYDSITGSTNSDMIEFCLNEIENNNKLFKCNNSDELYKNFLKKDYENNGYCSTLNVLINDKCFESAKRLFVYIEKKHIPEENYSTLMSMMLSKVSLLSNDSFPNKNKYAEKLFKLMWSSMEENHKRFFLHEIRSQYSPIRSKIISLLKDEKMVELLSEIIGYLDEKQIESIVNFDEPAYKTLLDKKIFNLNSLKHFMNSINDGESSISIDPEKLNDFKNHINNIIKTMEK